MNVTVNVTVECGTEGLSLPVKPSAAALNAVLFDFNPSSNPRVTVIKALHAALIQKMRDILDDEVALPAQKRTAAIAITELEGAQMRSVKALFAK